MSPPTLANPGGADPISGPDFLVGKIVSWDSAPGQDGALVMSDGSRWRVRSGAPNFRAVCNLIELALRHDVQLFVSGDRTSGVVDTVSITERLGVAKIAKNVVDQKLKVAFHGPPAIYYLRVDRPWFEQAQALLRQSERSEASLLNPDLLVSIDVVTSEIMDVRPPQ